MYGIMRLHSYSIVSYQMMVGFIIGNKLFHQIYPCFKPFVLVIILIRMESRKIEKLDENIEGEAFN